MDDDVAALLRDDGEHRVLFGFTKDIEGIAIGLVAGSATVGSYDDGALFEVDDSVQAWVDRKLAQADDRPALVEHVRARSPHGSSVQQLRRRRAFGQDERSWCGSLAGDELVGFVGNELDRFVQIAEHLRRPQPQ